MHIKRDTIRDFFRDNKEQGIDLHRDLLWGYFFYDGRRAALETLKKHLVDGGYQFGGISRRTDDVRGFSMEVQRVERHSAESLYERCVELDELAKRRGVDKFDGFQVGKVDGRLLTD